MRGKCTECRPSGSLRDQQLDQSSPRARLSLPRARRCPITQQPVRPLMIFPTRTALSQLQWLLLSCRRLSNDFPNFANAGNTDLERKLPPTAILPAPHSHRRLPSLFTPFLALSLPFFVCQQNALPCLPRLANQLPDYQANWLFLTISMAILLLT